MIQIFQMAVYQLISMTAVHQPEQLTDDYGFTAIAPTNGAPTVRPAI